MRDLRGAESEVQGVIEACFFIVLGFFGIGWLVLGLTAEPDLVGRNEAVKRMLARRDD